MATWEVYKYVRANGGCPIDDWRQSKALTSADRAALDSKIDAIEGISGRLPPEFVKAYKTSSVCEMKVRGDKKQLRPLCVYIKGRRIVLLSGAIEKGGKLPKGDLERAEKLKIELEGGYGRIESYHQD